MKYVLQKEDYLTYQLFAASKSKYVRTKRKKNRIFGTLFYLVAGLIMYIMKNDIISFIIFSITSLLWATIYPFYSKRRYIKHYSDHIDENYQERIGKKGSVCLFKDHIKLKNINSEGKITYEALVEIYKISTHFFINILSGEALILPKNNIDKTKLNKVIEYIRKSMKKGIIKELDWQWK